MLELKKVRQIVAIAKHGGFAKAAAALHISQSALTKSVQSVEERLGLKLLERGPRGARLTPEGERFVERGGRLLADAEELEFDARAMRAMRTGRVRIAAAPAALDIFWMDALSMFAARFPGIRVETVADSVENVTKLLLHGELDFAVGAFDALKSHGELEIELLSTWPIAPFVRNGHPLDGDHPPALRDLFAYPWAGPTVPEPHRSILQRLSAQFDSPYVQPHITVSSFPLTLKIVEETDVVSTVFSHRTSETSFVKRFRSWPDLQPLPPLEINLVSRRGWQPTHAARSLIEIIRSVGVLAR